MPRSEWINPAHFARCDGKRGFRSLAMGEIEAERASVETGDLILAYTCCDCGRVHIGHADLSQQLARIPHIDRPCKECGGIVPESKKQKAKRLQAVALYCSNLCQQVAAKRRRTERECLTVNAVTTEAVSAVPKPTGINLLKAAT